MHANEQNTPQTITIGRDPEDHPLIVEIKGLKKTLIEIDKDSTKDMNSIIEHNKRISEVLQTTEAQTLDLEICPFDELSSLQPLSRIEIPLEILETLTCTGVDLHDKRDCLWSAIRNHHYNVVRWLVEQGIDCNMRNLTETPVSDRYLTTPMQIRTWN